MKTRQEVIRLKMDWENDPCWDLEDTDGFEEYYIELQEFREIKEKEWEDRRITKLQKKSEELGIPGNLVLTSYIDRLEGRIHNLESIIHEKF